jgi:hypothetical protein
MKAYGGVDVQVYIFLTLPLVGCEWSASRPCLFPPTSGKEPLYHWIEGWVGLRAGLDGMQKTKFLTLLELELRHLSHPACCQLLYRISYCLQVQNFILLQVG